MIIEYWSVWVTDGRACLDPPIWTHASIYGKYNEFARDYNAVERVQ